MYQGSAKNDFLRILRNESQVQVHKSDENKRICNATGLNRKEAWDYYKNNVVGSDTPKIGQ